MLKLKETLLTVLFATMINVLINTTVFALSYPYDPHRTTLEVDLDGICLGSHFNYPDPSGVWSQGSAKMVINPFGGEVTIPGDTPYNYRVDGNLVDQLARWKDWNREALGIAYANKVNMAVSNTLNYSQNSIKVTADPIDIPTSPGEHSITIVLNIPPERTNCLIRVTPGTSVRFLE